MNRSVRRAAVRERRPWACAGAALLLLAGCASRAPEQSPVVPAMPESIPAPLRPDPGLQEFAARHRRAAEAAFAAAQWPQALAALDVLIALHPADAALRGRRAQAQSAAQAAALDRLQRARQAQQRGDTDGAARLYLETLALAPLQADAAEGLRALERERVRRLFVAQQARAPRRVPPVLAGPTTPAAERNEIEHATMLAAQGELDGAIAMLKPIAASGRGEATARSLLADLYFRQAETLAPTHRAAAIAALELCLKADPRHARATARLKQLREAGGAAR